MMPQDPWSLTLAGRPAVGQRAARRRRRRTAPRDVELFAELTGDRNPLHFDPALAARSPFGAPIVQGGVTSGLLNAVVAEELPGPGTVFLATEWRFTKAVRIGEEIEAEVEVVACRDDKPVCTLRTTVRNAAGEVCLAGSAVTWTAALRDAAPASGGGDAQRREAKGEAEWRLIEGFIPCG